VTFDAAAVTALFAAVESHAQTLGLFERVNIHEPKNAPGNGLSCSIWVESIKPVRSSGLASVSGVITFKARILSNMLAEPQDGIDPQILSAVCVLMAEYSGSFTLGGTVREIDLLGAEGEQLSAQAGYLSQDSRLFRAMELTIPVVINDMWTETP
jgi:hypothetical protein